MSYDQQYGRGAPSAPPRSYTQGTSGSSSAGGYRNNQQYAQQPPRQQMPQVPARSNSQPYQMQPSPPPQAQFPSPRPYGGSERSYTGSASASGRSQAGSAHPLSPHVPPQAGPAYNDPRAFGSPNGFLGQNPNAPGMGGYAPIDYLPRKKTVRKIPLTPQGNLVVDIPVSDKVLSNGKHRQEEEFSHMRYTAVTCTADEFSTKGYSLRQQEYGRHTEIFIVVTMYNEDDFLFCKSMQAIMKNIAHLCTRSRSKTWGNEGWKKVVVCIVSDGRTKVNRRVLDVLGLMGVYQDGVMKDHVNEKPVTAHLFEYTTQVAVDPQLNIKGYDKGFVPVQILFCLKEKNAKKINSHRWFFSAFGPLIKPNICMLIDVGTKPQETSLYHLWKAFDRNPSVAGACGEIYAELGTGCSNLLNPLVAAQNFEYKMSNILDKPLESVCGYISVLPGAFSAYRYIALQGKPLSQYFKGETMHGGASVSTANMYLAEDRILCFELVTKKDQAWVLKYVKSAKAETDVPDNVPEFISQRRRWLNGSFFAGVHALQHWYHIFKSGHNIGRKMLLLLEFQYNAIMTLFNWFGLSFFYLTFYFLAQTTQPTETTSGQKNCDGLFGCYGTDIFAILRQVYIAAIVTCFISAMGNRPQGSRWIYIGCMVLFALIMGIMLFFCGYSVYTAVDSAFASRTVKGWTDIKGVLMIPRLRDIALSLAATYGLYLISSCMFLEPWHLVTSFLQYLALMPSFINILMIYAFANLHDVSWGTKGDNSAATDLGAVTSSKSKDGTHVVSVEMPSERTDINASYDKFLKSLAQPRPDGKQKRDAKTKQEDHFKQYRTNLLLSWMFSNALVIIVLTTPALAGKVMTGLGVTQRQEDFNPFLKFTFYSVLGISFVRFLGATAYLVNRAICG
ncbi:chitin synthase-domain-containing protein [Fimicolochytrium jonesii]|uniref:chitin synthase-domain-containing protein n=1 Tax=Fimicolochytrium jonesii TaxID=1396493 RepID=UPI0022FF410A|nr:chitin synthase-domain-containing protein [Fimicolochytrium jonesii]KAI8816432.1 chitin synthase-domain-containing protein [Fimicolochytrium jonesii]